MKISNEGINLIKSFEGLRLKAYKPVPTEKEYTIGYGHYGVKKGAVITESQALEILKRDLERFELSVNHLLDGHKVNQHQFDALVSFAFNCGVGNLQKSTLLKLIKDGRHAEASKEFDKWNKAGGEVLQGLVRRRNAEQALFNKPVPKPPVTKKTYTVKKGDTLTEIAEKYKTTVAKLVKLNKLADADKIKTGQKLKLN